MVKYNWSNIIGQILTRTPVRSQQRFESRPSKAADTQPDFDQSGRTHAADTLSSTDWIRPHWSKSILVKVAIRQTQGYTRWSNHDNPAADTQPGFDRFGS